MFSLNSYRGSLGFLESSLVQVVWCDLGSAYGQVQVRSHICQLNPRYSSTRLLQLDSETSSTHRLLTKIYNVLKCSQQTLTALQVFRNDLMYFEVEVAKYRTWVPTSGTCSSWCRFCRLLLWSWWRAPVPVGERSSLPLRGKNLETLIKEHNLLDNIYEQVMSTSSFAYC